MRPGVATSGAQIKGRLAIVAGSGKLPLYIADAAREVGEDPFIFRLRNEADDPFDGFQSDVIGVGDLKGLADTIAREGIKRVVMSGAVKRRPPFSDIRVNLRSILKLPVALKTLLSGGDDAVLRMVISLLEAQGCQVVGAHQILPSLLANLGPIGARVPTAEDERDIARASAAAVALGLLDVGQGAVAVGGRIVALEGVEGTDAMLHRVAQLRADGRISQRRKGVLVKLCKPQQDVRVDLPTIGVSTVENAVKAGLAGIAVEAGRALVVEREAMIRKADEAGIFITGIDKSESKT